MTEEFASLKSHRDEQQSIHVLQQQLKALSADYCETRSSNEYLLGRALLNAKTLRGIALLFRMLTRAMRGRFDKERAAALAQSRQRLQSIIHSKQTRLPRLVNIKALYVLDEFSEESWSTEFELTPLDRQSYVEQIEQTQANFALLESCWHGNRDTWQYAFTSEGLRHHNAQALLDAIAKLKARGTPIVFWNKEDPLHYDRYLPIAKLCDAVFTTDSERVAHYKRDLPGAQIGVLPFAASPSLCNPSGRFVAPSKTICFAGTYFNSAHDNRKQQMDALLPAISAMDGVIYDRMSARGDKYSYPEEYKPFIRPAVPFRQMTEVYKSFQIFLNVNTIVDSPTMMSRRVYELLASGTPIISTPSRALAEQFPHIVQIATNSDEAIEISKALLSDEWKWLKLSQLGYREVLQKHTYAHRSSTLLGALGIQQQITSPLISAVVATMRPHFSERVAINLGRQTHPNVEAIFTTQGYTDRDLVTLREALAKHAPNLKRVVVIEDNSDATLGIRLNRMVEASLGDYIAKIDDDDLYFANYLSDMLLPFQHSQCGIVGKREVFMHLESSDQTVVRFSGQRHNHTSLVAGPTLVAKRSVLNSLPFPTDRRRGTDTAFLAAANERGILVYATDPFNFVQVRTAEALDHTWSVEDSYFTAKSRRISSGIPEDLVLL